MREDNMSKQESLQNELEKALRDHDTKKVYELSKLGANLKEFTIIGLSNIRGEWTRNVVNSVSSFMSQNDGVYYLPLNEISYIEDDDFIKNFNGLVNPGAGDSFPKTGSFSLSDLDRSKMLYYEHVYQAVINQSNRFHIPYLGICSGSQHLVLNSGGSVTRQPGYLGGNHKAIFIEGTIPYFLTLTQREQESAINECILPEISFPEIYTAHNYAGKKGGLANLELAAVSEEGVVQAHSKGTNQIGVQFHPENYYFATTPENTINRQKMLLDNFYGLCVKHHDILDYSRKNGVSEHDLYDRMNMYDIAILSRLKECSNKALSPMPLPYPYFNEDENQSVSPVALSKESYNAILDGKITSYLNKIDFSDQKTKYFAMQAIEDSETLRYFLQLDKQPNEIQESFVRLEQALKDPNQNPSLIIQEFSTLFNTVGDVGNYALMRAVKANNMEVASIILANNQFVASESFFDQLPKVSILKISNYLVQQGYVDQAFDLLGNNNTDLQDNLLGPILVQAVRIKAENVFTALLDKVTDQEFLGSALLEAIIGGKENMVTALLNKVSDPSSLEQALIETVRLGNEKMFGAVLDRVHDQWFLGKLLYKTVTVGTKKMVDSLLPRIGDLDWAYNNALEKAIELGNQDMIYALWPKATYDNRKFVIGTAVYRKDMPTLYALWNIATSEVHGYAVAECVRNNGNLSVVYDLLPKVIDQSSFIDALELAISKSFTQVRDDLIPLITNQELLYRLRKHAEIVRSDEAIDIIDSALNDDISIRKEKMLKHLLSMNISPEDFSNHLKSLNESDYISIIEKSLIKIKDLNFLKALAENSEDNIKNIVNERIEQLQLTPEELLKWAINNNKLNLVIDIMPEIRKSIASEAIFRQSLKQAAELGNREIVDVLLTKVIDQDSLVEALGVAKANNDNKMVDAIESELQRDINTRQEEILQYLLDVNISPKDFSYHLKSLTELKQGDYISVIEKSLVAIKDVNFLKVVAENSEDNIKNIVNERIEQLLLTPEELLRSAINKNRLDLVIDIMPNIKSGNIVKTFLKQALEAQNWPLFDALLVGIDGWLISDIIGYAIEARDETLTDALLAKLTEQNILGRALKKAVQVGNERLINSLLDRVTDQWYLYDTLSTAIDFGKASLFYPLLSRVTDQSNLITLLPILFEDKVRFNAVLTRVTEQSSLEKALRGAIYDKNKGLVDALLPTLVDKYDIPRPYYRKRDEITIAIEAAFEQDDNTRQKEMLKYFLDMNVSPEDFSNHIKAARGRTYKISDMEYVSAVQESLLKIDDINFLKIVAERSEDNIKNIVNERIEQLAQQATHNIVDRVSEAASYILERTGDMFGGLPVAGAQTLDNSAASQLVRQGNNMITSGLSDEARHVSGVTPAGNAVLPDIAQQIQLAATLGQLINNSYQALTSYFTTAPSKKHVNKALQSTNDKIHERLLRLSKAPELSKELASKSNSMNRDRKVIANNFMGKYKEICDQTEAYSKEYYNMKDPTKEKLYALLENVQALNKKFEKLISETVTKFPELAPNKKEEFKKKRSGREGDDFMSI